VRTKPKVKGCRWSAEFVPHRGYLALEITRLSRMEARSTWVIVIIAYTL